MGLSLILRISLILLPLAMGRIEFDHMEKNLINPSDFYGLVEVAKVLSFTKCYLLCLERFATECSTMSPQEQPSAPWEEPQLPKGLRWPPEPRLGCTSHM